MLNTIKKYLKKAKEEVSKEYTIGPSRSSDTVIYDESGQPISRGWFGVDLDGTLAMDNLRSSASKVGAPVPRMVELVKKMVHNGIRVKIFTARATDAEQLPIIRKWLKDNGLPELEITNIKDYNMLRLYDDRCIQVERNTGRLILDKKTEQEEKQQ